MFDNCAKYYAIIKSYFHKITKNQGGLLFAALSMLKYTEWERPKFAPNPPKIPEPIWMAIQIYN